MLDCYAPTEPVWTRAQRVKYRSDKHKSHLKAAPELQQNCHGHNFHTDDHNGWTLKDCSAAWAAGPNQ